MRGWFVSFMLGWALAGLAVLLALFGLLAAALNENPSAWLLAAAASAVPALPLVLRGRFRNEPSRRSILAATLLLWLVVPAFGSLPWVFSGQLNALDALFESMSGFTTTGASMISDPGVLSGSFLLWRALSQWLGGIGIIVVFAAVFPQLGVAGRQLFIGEEPGPREDRLAPRLQQAAAALLAVYVALTLLSLLSYWIAGLDLLHAAAYAAATLAAGGVSILPEAAGTFELPVFEFIGLLFMLLAGTNLTLQYRAWNGRVAELFRDAEFRSYLVVIGLGSLLLFVLLRGSGGVLSALFQVVSVITTTGFTTQGMTEWPQQAQLLLLALMFVGGCAGSAAGGIRIMRWLIVLRSTGKEVQRMLHPRAALPLRIGHRLITPEVLRSTAAFFTVYVLLVGVSAFALALLGLDHLAALSSALSSTGLVGFAFQADGQFVDFGLLPAAAKAVLLFDMYAGRLEIVTLAVLLVPGFWRLPRRRRPAA